LPSPSEWEPSSASSSPAADLRQAKLSVEVTSEDAAFVEGYVIPDTYRTRFVEVPNPDAGVRVRYYNNTAYYIDPSYRIVRALPLQP